MGGVNRRRFRDLREEEINELVQVAMDAVADSEVASRTAGLSGDGFSVYDAIEDAILGEWLKSRGSGK